MELWWEADTPAMASIASRQRLADAEERVRELDLSKDRYAGRIADEQVNRAVTTAKLSLATGQDAATLRSMCWKATFSSASSRTGERMWPAKR